MELFSLKSLFIFDPTLKSKKRKPSEDELQDIKLLYYYPNNEDIHIKRSNSGIIEGTISFLDAFEKSEEKFILAELNKCFYIANKFEDNKYIVLLLDKTTTHEFSYFQNTEVKNNWLKIFINNFYDVFLLYNGLISDLFFKPWVGKNSMGSSNHNMNNGNGNLSIQSEIGGTSYTNTDNNNNNSSYDIRENNEEYKHLCSLINDFVIGYFESLSAGHKLPFLDNILYFPLNEISYAQILLATQRLNEKIPEIKYSSIMYKGFLLHNEAPLDSMTVLYNSFFSNIDSNPKFYNFARPPYKVVQTIYSGMDDNIISHNTVSNFRKAFDINTNTPASGNYLIGINKLNINNFHVFIPTIHMKSTDEKVKLIVYYLNGLLIFLFLNETFNPASKITALTKLEKWGKRYFDEMIPILENLYIQKTSKLDNITFAYMNNSNKSIKLSSTFFNKKNKFVEREKIELLFNIFKLNYNNNSSSLTKLKGYYIYYIVSCERKVVVILPENLSLATVKMSIEEIKKELFDYIFML